MNPAAAGLQGEGMAAEAFNEWLAYPLSWLAVAVIAWAFVKGILRILGGGAGAYVGKKGEHLATKEDFDQLLEQLRRNTEATESIRTELAHKEWTAREWKAARARKLEEFITVLHRCSSWIDKASGQIFKREMGDVWAENPATQLKALQIVYFPEMKALVFEFDKKAHGAVLAFAQFISDHFEDDAATYSQAFGENRQRFVDVTNDAHRALLIVTSHVTKLLRSIYGDLPATEVYPLLPPGDLIPGLQHDPAPDPEPEAQR